MNQFLSKLLGCLLLAVSISLSYAQAQVTVSGKVSDTNGEGLIGVNVTVKGKLIGTVTDSKGSFNLNVNLTPPFTLQISNVGFQTQELEINGNQSDIAIKLEEQNLVGEEVVVSASRVEESIMESPVAIEKMDILAVRNVSTATFYESLQNLKGVEIATQSLTFQSVNTRGFAATGNVRLLQLIDGMDSQSITNNFSYGNLVGVNELDVESVELLPGASSVLFGPGAINGTLLINSKNPFNYQGLSVQTMFGMMHNGNDDQGAPRTPYYNLGLRYAKAFNDKVAFKINVGYVGTPRDWYATNTDNTLNGGLGLYDNTNRQNNPSYDGVNVYGDEGFFNRVAFSGVNVQNPLNPNNPADRIPFSQLLSLGLQQQGVPQNVANALGTEAVRVPISRTGRVEPALANYNAYSAKIHAALHWRIGNNAELITQLNVNNGRTIYTGSGRFNVSNFYSGQFKLELKGTNYFVRSYINYEDAGDSYDVQQLGQFVENGWRNNNDWFGDYFQGYLGARLGNPAFAPLGVAGPLADLDAHNFARRFADNTFGLPGRPARPADGSAEVERIKNEGINTPISKGGARFKARNYFWHNEVMYNFNKLIDPKTLEIIAGAHLRRYVPNTDGTIFDDLNNAPTTEELTRFPNLANVRVRKITVTEVGAYVQLSKRLLADRWKIVAAARIDKNQNFEARFTPRISNVITLGEKRNHNIRLSYQTGFRNPTMLDQYQNLTVGGIASLIGGLDEFKERYFRDAQGNNIPVYSLRSLQEEGKLPNFAPFNTPPFNGGDPNRNAQAITFNRFRPEFVQTVEIGYKAILFKNLFIDTYFYYNWYNNYNGSLLVYRQTDFTFNPTPPITGNSFGVSKVFQVPYNLPVDLKSLGWGLGLEYRFNKGYNLSGNISRDVLDDIPYDQFAAIGFIPAFNTPGYRTNMAFSNRNVYKGLGFNLVWRWQDSFIWQSGGFFSGDIPAYHSFDLNFNYKLKAIKSILKIGGSNIFNQRYFQAYGNPRLGSTYYISITFDEILN
jgi:iron complex outermembrane recepter protein